MPNHWEPSPDQRTKLFYALGLCLFVYQSIELRLKFLLPHLVVPGTDTHAPGEGFANWKVFLDSKKTLGPLIQHLKERVASKEKESLERTWTELVEQRNDVIHHFASKPFARLSSQEEFDEAMQFLQQRHQFAAPILSMLQQFSESFLAALQSTDELGRQTFQ